MRRNDPRSLTMLTLSMFMSIQDRVTRFAPILTDETYLLSADKMLQSAQTLAGNQSFPAPGTGNETGHAGNGYARITFQDN